MTLIFTVALAHAGTFCKLEIPEQPQRMRPNATLSSRADDVRRGQYPGPLFPMTKSRGNWQVSNGQRWFDEEGNVYRWWVVDLAMELHPRSAEAYRQGNQDISPAGAVGQVVISGYDLAQTESGVPDGFFSGAKVSPQATIFRLGSARVPLLPALCMYNTSMHNAKTAEVG